MSRKRIEKRKKKASYSPFLQHHGQFPQTIHADSSQFSVMICRSPRRRLIQPLENRRGLTELPLTSVSHIMYYSRFICMNIGGHGFNSLLANMSVTAITKTRRGVASYSITWKKFNVLHTSYTEPRAHLVPSYRSLYLFDNAISTVSQSDGQHTFS